MLYCSRRWGWHLFLAESYQGLVIISLPSRRKNLLRGSGLCNRKEDPNEVAQLLREDFLLHKKLEHCQR